MSDLFVDVKQSADQPALIRESFDTLALLSDGPTAVFAGRSKTYKRGEIGDDFDNATKEFDLAENKIFAQNPRVSKILVVREDAADIGNITTIYNAIRNEPYFVLIPINRNLADQKTLSSLNEPDEKLLLIGSDDANIKDAAVTTDVAQEAKDNLRDFTAVFFDDQSTLPEALPAAHASRILGLGDVGLATWHGTQNLKNVLPSTLTSQEIIDIGLVNATWNAKEDANNNATVGGKVASGKFIDSIRGRAALKSAVDVGLTQLILNTDKIPYDDSGIDMIAQVIEAEAVGFEGTFLRKGESKVTSPTFAEIDELNPDDIDNRIINGFVLTAREKGAIHFITITIGVQI